MRYYDLLNPSEQRAYLKLVAGIRECSAEITIALKSFDQERIKRVIIAIHQDCPELFYVDFRQYRKKRRVPLARIRFDYLYTAAEIQDIQKALDDLWFGLKEKVICTKGIKQKFRMMALEIGEKVKYRAQELCDYSIAGPLKNKCGACEAVSKLLLCCCHRACIPAVLVIGKYEGSGHAWVKVWINRSARYIDITVIQKCPLFFRFFPWLILIPRGLAYLLGYRELPKSTQGHFRKNLPAHCRDSQKTSERQVKHTCHGVNSKKRISRSWIKPSKRL